MSVKSFSLAILASVLLLNGCGEPGYPESLRVEQVNRTDLKAMLFVPKSPAAKLPTVIVVGGSEGGVNGAARTAQAFAERGVAALAVAYFGMPGLPATLNQIPLEYFDAALQFIDSSTQLSRNQCEQVAIIGSSRGAELALLLGANSPEYGPIIAISPSSHVWGAINDKPAAAWTLGNEPLPYVPRHSKPDYSVKRFVGREYFKQDLMHEDAAAAMIDLRSIQSKVLLFAGTDDQLWPSDQMARAIHTQFKETGSGAQVASFFYPDAGHVIAPGLPSDLNEAMLENSQILVLGGQATANAAASKDILAQALTAINSPMCYKRNLEL